MVWRTRKRGTIKQRGKKFKVGGSVLKKRGHRPAFIKKKKVYYWQPVPIEEWEDRLKAVANRVYGPFSIVYRFYSEYDGYVRYVGRSDKPFSRAEQHWNMIEDYGVHNLGGRVVWVDFTYFAGYGRKRAAYKEECRRYHLDEPDLNTSHPAKPKGCLYKCPICSC